MRRCCLTTLNRYERTFPVMALIHCAAPSHDNVLTCARRAWRWAPFFTYFLPKFPRTFSVLSFHAIDTVSHFPWPLIIAGLSCRSSAVVSSLFHSLFIVFTSAFSLDLHYNTCTYARYQHVHHSPTSPYFHILVLMVYRSSHTSLSLPLCPTANASLIPLLAPFTKRSSQIPVPSEHREPTSVKFVQIDLHLNEKTWRIIEVHSVHFSYFLNPHNGISELSAATRQVLAEAAIYTNNYSNNVDDSFADFGDIVGAAVAMDGDDSTEEDEGSEMHSPVAGHDRHAVSVARMQVFKWYVYSHLYLLIFSLTDCL